MAHSRRPLYAALGGLIGGLVLSAVAAGLPASPAASGNPAAPNGLLELPLSPSAPPAPPPAMAPSTPPVPAPAMAPAPASPAPLAPAGPPLPAGAPPAVQVSPSPPSSTAMPPNASPYQAQPTATTNTPPLTAPAAKQSEPRAAGQQVLPASTLPDATFVPSAKALQDVGVKNPDVLLQPIHLETTSLMFSKSDMNVITQALEVYDNSTRLRQADNSSQKEDLSSLLDSLKSHTTAEPGETPAALPNLYLGSILYYSPSHWSVWVNGKKLLSRNNHAGNEFYIDRLSSSEVELVWKPAYMLDVPSLWRQRTDNGAHPLPQIGVDESKGTITLRLRANQTFLPHSLTVREGLIRHSAATTASAANSQAGGAPAPAIPQPPPSPRGGPAAFLNRSNPMPGQMP